MNKWIVLSIALLNGFVAPFMGAAINVAAPVLAVDLNMNAIELNWATTIFLLSSAICLIPVGRLADIYGRKRFLFIGNVLLLISSILVTFAPNTFFFLFIRCIQGISISFSYGTSMALLANAFPINQRGKVFGIHAASVYVGLSSGPVLGGFLVQSFGWESIFYIPIFMSAIAVFLIYFKIKDESIKAAIEIFDWKGSVFYGSILASLTYGFSILPSMLGYSLILMGIILFLPFVFYQSHTPSPLFKISLFHNNPVFAYSNLAALIHYSATAGVGFLLSLYLQYIKGLTPKEAGMILMVQPVIMAIFSPLMGTLSDKIEPRLVASAGMFMTFGGLVFLAFLSSTTEIFTVYTALIFMGMGFALFSSPNTNAAISAIDKKDYAIASSTLGTMRFGGQIFSMVIVMGLFSLLLGRVKIVPENYETFLVAAKYAFTLFAVLCLLGTYASMKRGNLR